MPHRVKGAPWHRCILTDQYAMVLDTEKIQIPHMGTASLDADLSHINALPSASLKLNITVQDKTYQCMGAQPYGKNTGPRIVESGYFFQRADVTHLIFKADDGTELNTIARFETAAWSDRVSFILYAEPGENSTDSWENASMSIELSNATGTLKTTANYSDNGTVALAFNPLAMKEVSAAPLVTVTAKDQKSAKTLPVTYQHDLGWHEINLFQIKPHLPEGKENKNDELYRAVLTLTNPTDTEQSIPLMFNKRGNSITGVTALIRDLNGMPTGIPVQLSKNWHTQIKVPYSGSWFHGISRITTPPNSTIKLELVIAHAHWGGVAAASHAQLSLIGWGSNQLWEQSALGAWGESICYEPDQAQASALITDVRPLMVKSDNEPKLWKWTGNVGGGDYCKLFAPSGERMYHSSVRTERLRQGPCLTEITYTGNLDKKAEHSITTSISRTDDIVRGTYHIKLKVNENIPFSRFVIFQIGADTYNMSREKKFATGDLSNGFIKEWNTKTANGAYINPPEEYTGQTPWFSMHDAESTDDKGKCLSNRGFIIRSWKARLGGKETSPWVGEYGTIRHKREFSILDITPPSNVSELLPGDYVDAVIEYIVMPQKAKHYYGPNEQLRSALHKAENTWKMIFREAQYNSHQVKVTSGKLIHTFPDIRIEAHKSTTSLKFKNGLGYIPFTFTGLKKHSGHKLMINGKELDQSVHGNDFWQTDFDIKTQTWSLTYNVPLIGEKSYKIDFIQKL